MAPARIYIPSAAVLRALTRPQPPRCPFARPLTAQFVRGKRSKAKAQPVDTRKLPPPVQTDDLDPNTPPKGPVPDHVLNESGISGIEWYERDLDKGTPDRLISRIETREDMRRDQEMLDMLEEDDRNPDYDDTELKRRLIDSLITNPNFADLTEELQAMKADVLSPDERRAQEQQLAKEMEPEMKEMDSMFHMAVYESLDDMLKDPDIAEAHADIRQLRDNIPEKADLENPEFQNALVRLNTILGKNPAFQKKLAVMREQEALDEKEEDSTVNQELAQELETFDPDKPIETPEDLDKLLLAMKGLMKEMGGDKELEDELDSVINEDPFAEEDGTFEREMDFTELAEEIKKLSVAGAGKAATTQPADDAYENLDPETKAKVDKIMDDPKLMEKLLYIQDLLVHRKANASTSASANRDLTAIPHSTAPDPITLSASRTTSLGARIKTAESDPSHVAAMQRLHITLLPPFHVNPSLRSLNKALKFSYVGANDSVRRILWRAYQRARTVPTLLQNIPDDAWDLIYYSQAVTWGSNQNRLHHLRVILGDLKSLGREGPPTHPATLVPRGEEGEEVD
ncbi:hypothetical protein BDV95DRAFT_590334 [Massariosphaeria phaeospora]|uniref:Uncharacterized protein n=1 Tax=Massariosphaeria phaeospora TaxID=100035 RepID=A0A7C8ML75_9PLEO|nr:hypothetical protein BDV95DRAFT_590334 [Massariosphaeria phaeospora]